MSRKLEVETEIEKGAIPFEKIQEGRTLRHAAYGVCQKLKCIQGSPPAIAISRREIGVCATAFSLTHGCPVLIESQELVSAAVGADVKPEPQRFVQLERVYFLATGPRRQSVTMFDRREGVFV